MTNRPIMPKTVAMMSVIQAVQRQPMVSVTNPPTIGPATGPQNVPEEKTQTAYALWTGSNMSTRIPPITASGAPAAKPEMNLPSIIVSNTQHHAVVYKLVAQKQIFQLGGRNLDAFDFDHLFDTIFNMKQAFFVDISDVTSMKEAVFECFC